VPDSASFVSQTEPFRRELLAHCYRMLGSVHDAEDLVQETYLRAWRSYDRFEGRSSLRTWLYQIATNACLTALVKHGRRMLPSGLGPPSTDPSAAAAPAGADVSWLQPIPDSMAGPGTAAASHPGDDPAAIVARRGDLRLALIASLQYLPARQRAVLVLRDVLAFPAAEVAAMLGITTASVKSALQRARARLLELGLVAEDLPEPTSPRARALLDQYIAAFENADADALERLLLAEVTLEATPLRSWYRGRGSCVPFLRTHVLGVPGDWRMLPASANGQPAAVCFTRGAAGAYQPYGVCLLTIGGDGISRVVSFGDPGLVGTFGHGA
jgi:RNA polymerase sigma-70 factor, ECF subfamily